MKAYIIEKTFCFREVYNVDPDLSFKTISHFEHEPLQFTATIRIISHPNIEHFGLSLTNLIEVSTLKRRIKSHRFRLSCDAVCHFDGHPVKLLHV